MKKNFLFFLYILLIGWSSSVVISAGQTSGKAVFAGGCFWCMESDFEKITGVNEVISGYIGGTGKNPTYKNYGKTGHIEAIQILYDPSVVTYSQLLEIFWHRIDPTDANGQFCDRGHEYSTAVFYSTAEQKQLAEQSKTKLERSAILKKPIVTPIIKDNGFYRAEEYHQDYYKKNPYNYKSYRSGCGRDQKLKQLWGDNIGSGNTKVKISKYQKPGKKELKKKLSSLQYRVTQHEGTEPPFKNEYWDNKKEGIYVDIVSGEPLFSSLDKFRSGTGWPSFTRPLEPENIIKKEDRSLYPARTEIRSKYGDSHLGHLFNDGPRPTRLRYCINSAALRFIAKKDLEKEGYGDYLKLFQK